MTGFNHHQSKALILSTIFFLLLFQLLADFVEAVYAFGLMRTGIPPQIIAVLLFLSPVLWVLFPRALAVSPVADGLFLVFVGARLLDPVLNTYPRMLVAGTGVAAGLLLLPFLLRARSRARDLSPWGIGWGLLTATLLSALLRTWGIGLDASTVGWGQGLGALLVAIGVGTWFSSPPVEREISDEQGGQSVVLPALGFMSVLILLYVVFTAPHVLSHWTPIPYPWVGMAYAIGTLLALWWLPFIGRRPDWLLAANVLFLAALTGTAYINQPRFPATPDAYPLLWRSMPLWSGVGVGLVAFLFPVLFVDATVLTRTFRRRRPSMRQMGWAFTAAAFYLLIAIFAHVFTTVYDYIPVVGPFFRNAFWQIHLAIGLVLLTALARIEEKGAGDRVAAHVPRAVGAVLAALMVLAVWSFTPHPQPPVTPPSAVTVMTYNIQQGYSEAGERNFDGQLALMRDADADIIGLEETDDARISGGNADVARYMAYHLNMYAYYGPTTPAGTFGIALLSRYPIRSPRTWFLYSKGEQVAVIEATVQVGGHLLRVFVTHLGNGGPMIQQAQFLRLVDRQPSLVALGDFNFRPDTSQYSMTTRVLVDTWTARWPTWEDARGVRPTNKIDHIFVSPDMKVLDARYILSPASDHPAVTATIAWNR